MFMDDHNSHHDDDNIDDAMTMDDQVRLGVVRSARLLCSSQASALR